MSIDQSRALLAVVLSGIILIGWNYFFGARPQITQQTAPESFQTPQISESSRPVVAPPPPLTVAANVQTYELSDSAMNSYRINSNFAILSVKTYLSTTDFVSAMGSLMPFEFFVPQDGQYVRPSFQFQKISNSKLRGLDKKLGISLALDILEQGKLHMRIDFQRPIRARLVFHSREFDSEKEKVGKSGPGIMSFPGGGDYKFIRRFLFLAKDLEEVLVGDEDSGDLRSRWFGIDSNYHLFAFVLPEKKSIRYHSNASGRLEIDFNQEASFLEGNFVYAKKDYDNLKALGENLHLGVDFGFFAIIAVPLFKGLQFLYKAIPNWGVAIILLTLLIRLATFPLYYKQMKSMNKMKKIQPKLQKIKEKHKDDTKRQQMETMELFKREGVNPMGGCLPLILQMPIFIAFYKVLTVSAELDGQPFMGWITSLTEKDPYYLLPIVVTFLMWLNQKIMPQTATDPTQQKIMGLMPLIFGFIFLNMPAGLNLYILISTGFGILQQLFVNKRMEQFPA